MEPSLSIEFLRSFRVFQIAIFDLVISYLGIYLISPLIINFSKKIKIKTNKAQLLYLTLPASIIVHLLVGQETTLTKMFLDPSNYYLTKIIILSMIYMAFRRKAS